MSQKRLSKSVLFCLDQSFFFREFKSSKRCKDLKNLLNAGGPLLNFLIAEKHFKKLRLDPDSLFDSLIENCSRKTLKKFEKPTKCRKTPAQFFIYEKTLCI